MFCSVCKWYNKCNVWMIVMSSKIGVIIVIKCIFKEGDFFGFWFVKRKFD